MSGDTTILLKTLNRNFDEVPKDIQDILNESFDRFEYIPSDSGVDTVYFSITNDKYPLEPTPEDESYSLQISND